MANLWEPMMNRWLALAGVVAMISACAGLSNTGGDPAYPGPAAEAAYLGYHGPVYRARQYAD
jgi:hypothetical protein